MSATFFILSRLIVFVVATMAFGGEEEAAERWRKLMAMNKDQRCKEICWGAYTCEKFFDLAATHLSSDDEKRSEKFRLEKENILKECEENRVKKFECPESCIGVMHINNPLCISLMAMVILVIIIFGAVGSVAGYKQYLNKKRAAQNQKARISIDIPRSLRFCDSNL